MPDRLLVLIENGQLLCPEPVGIGSILIAAGKILKIGSVDRRALDALGIEYEAINAVGAWVTPGFIDPHCHLLGGSGEGRYSLDSPRILLSEIVPVGITTVVGVLGTDTTMKSQLALLGRVKGLNEEGLSVLQWTGGYNVPPTTILSSIREDMVVVDEIIGAGEIAISDHRALDPDPHELARLVLDVHVGGLLTGKAGLTHFYVGKHPAGLAPLREIIEKHAIQPEWLYPTHITRSESLSEQAVKLAQFGAYVDTDTLQDDTSARVRTYLEQGGRADRLTLSTDSGLETPAVLLRCLKQCVDREGIPLSVLLRLVTANTATALRLSQKGRLAVGCDADVLVLDRDLTPREVLARGRRMVADGNVLVDHSFRAKSQRVLGPSHAPRS